MSPKLEKILQEKNITIEYFATLTEGEALRGYKIGRKHLKEIAELLYEKNLKFKGESVFLKSFWLSKSPLNDFFENF